MITRKDILLITDESETKIYKTLQSSEVDRRKHKSVCLFKS